MQHSIYLHFPFCTHRCAYCDFNTYAGQESLIPAYVDALCREVELVGNGAPRDLSAHTVFFGGGTPSLLLAPQVERVLTSIRNAFAVDEAVEITLEANPGTVSLQALQDLRRVGVNRLSLGVQSANGEELRQLERTHDFGDVLRSVSQARIAGFDNLSLDLIFGLPEQAQSTWRTTLERILALRPEHISAYCLTLEHGTPFGQWARHGLLSIPDPDGAATMYELAEELLGAAGYQQYEISNWAQPGRQCRHNLQYWRGEPYLGLGAGAHGYAGGYRYSNVLAIREYIARLGPKQREPRMSGAQLHPTASESRKSAEGFPCSPAAVERHGQSAEEDMADFMIMGLRLTHEGIGEHDFRARFGRTLGEVYEGQLAKLGRLGLIEAVPADGSHGEQAAALGQRVRLTNRGRLLGNRAFLEFVR